VRSTSGADTQHFNAETLDDHMRLDYYGTVANWQNGLEHDRRWLEGVAFTEQSLKAEKPHVSQEVDHTVGNGFTHKFALAAWAQAYRYGKKQVAIRGDIVSAPLREIQRYRNDRLVVLDRIVVCVVGGVEPGAALFLIAKQLEGIRSDAKSALPVETSSGNRDITWDLDARHLLITWPIPDADKEDYAFLMIFGHLLSMRIFGDSYLTSMTGPALAGADLRSPEGAYFYVSVSLKRDAPLPDVRQKIWSHVEALRKDPLSQAPLLGQQFAFSLTHVMDPATIQQQAPPGATPAMMEGNLGLQYGMAQFRYGPHLNGLAQKLSSADATRTQQAAQRHLTADKSSVYTISPAKPAN